MPTGGPYFGAVSFGQYGLEVVQTVQAITGISKIGAAVPVYPATPIYIRGRACISNYILFHNEKIICGQASITHTGPTGYTGYTGATGYPPFTGGTKHSYTIAGRAAIYLDMVEGGVVTPTFDAWSITREKVISGKAHITSEATSAPPTPDPGTSPIHLTNTGLVFYIKGKSTISNSAPSLTTTKFIGGKACIKF